jgi:phosphohistidine phosphatase SixA
MLVFIMRHGEAATQAATDAERQLTEKGSWDIKDMVERCKDDLITVDEIWSSQYVRAQQTANILSGILNKPVQTQPWLAPTENPDKLVNALREVEQTVLIVSHQPLVGTFVDKLAGLENGRYRMGTAAIACIETDVFAYGCGELRWLHQPE